MKQPCGRSAIWVACLLVGLVGGASVGLAQEVTLAVEEPTYAVGDTVVFVWTNDTDSTLVAVNLPPYEIYDFDSGELVAGPLLPTEYHLPPHTAARLTWDQQGGNLGEGLQQVPEGHYSVEIYYYIVHENVGHFAGHLVEDFWIMDVSPVQPVSWGAIKAMMKPRM
jgi:hypothetical protein